MCVSYCVGWGERQKERQKDRSTERERKAKRQERETASIEMKEGRKERQLLNMNSFPKVMSFLSHPISACSITLPTGILVNGDLCWNSRSEER